MNANPNDFALTSPPPDDQGLPFERLLRDPNIDVKKLEAFMALWERMQATQAKQAFNEAFAQMQGELPTIDETGAAVMNGQRRYSYATQETIIEMVRPVLQKHGFSLRFRHLYPDGKIKVIGILSHRHGHSEEDEFEARADTSGSKNEIQAVGSTRTYGERYTTRSLLGIVSRDPNDPARDTDGQRTPSPVAATPAGYDDWLDLMRGKAEAGTMALYAAWKEAKPEFRAAMPREVRERLKATAAQVQA